MRNVSLVALTVVCTVLVVGYASASAEAQALSTPDGALFLTIDLQVDPEKVDEFLAMMIEAAPDTRARDGCRLFDIYVDQDNPGHVVFYEIWDSKAQQEAYVSWRQESGFNARIGPYMVPGGGGLTYFNKVDG
jgi:quinol monooxygenase YgiN